MSYIATAATGRATAAIRDAVVQPRLRPYRNPVCYLHSSGTNGTEALGVLLTNIAAITRRLARAGFVVGAPTATGLWGNSTAATRLTAMETYLRSEFAASGDLVLIGSSHGAQWALSYAAAHPEDVAAVIGFIPVIDLAYVRDNNVGGLRASIDTAWGVAHPTALPAGSDPATLTDELAEVPIQLWYASDDAVSTNIAAFASATGAEMHNVGALGHTDAAIAAVDSDAVAAFIEDTT